MELVVDMSNGREKQMILDKIRGLAGFHRIDIKKYHRRRTDRQNRYYWPCFAQPFADFLCGQGEPTTDDEAHKMMASKFLRVTRFNRETGEVIGDYVRSTTDLTTVEFNEYLDNCANWLAQQFGILVPDPDVYREQETAGVNDG